MTIVDVSDAQIHLAALIARAESGEDVVIARAGRPILRLVPVDGPSSRTFGGLDFHVPDDVDAPLPEDEVAAWEGADAFAPMGR